MTNLNELNADDAIKTIAGVADPDLLRLLRNQESDGKARKSVMAAIDAALEPAPAGNGWRHPRGQVRVLRMRRTVALGAGTRKRGCVIATTEAQGKPVEVISAVLNGDAAADWDESLTDTEIANLKLNPRLIEVVGIDEARTD